MDDLRALNIQFKSSNAFCFRFPWPIPQSLTNLIVKNVVFNESFTAALTCCDNNLCRLMVTESIHKRCRYSAEDLHLGQSFRKVTLRGLRSIQTDSLKVFSVINAPNLKTLVHQTHNRIPLHPQEFLDMAADITSCLPLAVFRVIRSPLHLENDRNSVCMFLICLLHLLTSLKHRVRCRSRQFEVYLRSLSCPQKVATWVS
jgi:hypothetical protein